MACDTKVFTSFFIVEVVTKLAATTVNVAPMLGILFIGARMLALQIDPKHGNPQK